MLPLLLLLGSIAYADSWSPVDFGGCTLKEEGGRLEREAAELHEEFRQSLGERLHWEERLARLSAGEELVTCPNLNVAREQAYLSCRPSAEQRARFSKKEFRALQRRRQDVDAQRVAKELDDAVRLEVEISVMFERAGRLKARAETIVQAPGDCPKAAQALSAQISRTQELLKEQLTAAQAAKKRRTEN